MDLSSKIEEFPVILKPLQYNRQYKMGYKIYQPWLIMAYSISLEPFQNSSTYSKKEIASNELNVLSWKYKC